MSTEHIPPAEVAAGTKDEHAEHNMPLPAAKRTALDHLREFPHYYSDLAKAEPKFRKTAFFATEALEQRKTAVFRDLAHKDDHKPGKDILADRAASASFQQHENKHVRGTEGEQFICFPDAAAHAGLAYLAWKSKGRLERVLPASLAVEVGALQVNTDHQSTNHEFNQAGVKLRVGMDTESPLVATVHTRNNRMVSPALSAFARQTLREVFGPAAATTLEAIKAPSTTPRPFAPLNRSK